MRCPRKVYIVVSRKASSEIGMIGFFLSSRAAAGAAQRRNAWAMGGATDWRVETFVKGGGR